MMPIPRLRRAPPPRLRVLAALLAATAFGIRPDVEAMTVEGIERVTAQDIASARTMGCRIKLLAVDGVQPTVENIRNGSYPLTVDLYAVTAGTNNTNVPKLLDWVVSAEGQKLIEQVGYVGLK